MSSSGGGKWRVAKTEAVEFARIDVDPHLKQVVE